MNSVGWFRSNSVAPHMGAWIEILKSILSNVSLKVAPHMGAWIEIVIEKKLMSRSKVAPHMGAWIEIKSNQSWIIKSRVAPHMGAWIEMVVIQPLLPISVSHPTWVRGLKFSKVSKFRQLLRRTPHGCVD